MQLRKITPILHYKNPRCYYGPSVVEFKRYWEDIGYRIFLQGFIFAHIPNKRDRRRWFTDLGETLESYREIIKQQTVAA